MTGMSITDHKYVSFSTFKKDGTAVATPVWIVALGDGTAGFTTDLTSGKAKRLKNNTSVTLRPCDMRGRIPEGAETVEAIAVVVTGDDAKRVESAIRRKYPVMGTLIGIGGALKRLVKKSASGDAAAVVITLP